MPNEIQVNLTKDDIKVILQMILGSSWNGQTLDMAIALRLKMEGALGPEGPEGEPNVTINRKQK